MRMSSTEADYLCLVEVACDHAQSYTALQCDTWRPLRLPGLLVGDGHLGGISTTIGAQECLLLRGYDLAAIVLMDSGLANWKYLREHFGGRVPVIGLPPCSPPPQTSCAFQISNPLCCIAAAFFLWSQKHAALKPRIIC